MCVPRVHIGTYGLLLVHLDACPPGLQPHHIVHRNLFLIIPRPRPPYSRANVRQMHAGLYHTYVEHYKEMECFKSIWEDTFYE